MEGARIAAVEVISRRFKGRGALPYSGRLSSEILDGYDPKPSKQFFKERLTLFGRIFIDGTETGELIAMSRARHELGYVSSDGKVLDPECVTGFVFPVLARAGSPTAKESREFSRFKLVQPRPAFDFDGAQGGKPRFTFWKEDRRGAPKDFAHYRTRRTTPLS